jgi:hypothetical protein
MKISQLLSGHRIMVTNEEQKFIDRNRSAVRLTALDERDTWVAQNLVRKGLYNISKDNNTLIRAVKDDDHS